MIGLGISHRLSPSITVVPGSESSRAQQFASDEFGPSVLVPILLEGPAKQLHLQGPRLVVALGRRPDVRVMSAWSKGETGASLRPRPGAAMIVASVAQSERAMVDTVQPELERIVAKEIGLRRTAAVATGAAAVMIAAALPFAFSALGDVRQFGIGIAIAVAIAPVIVRPVLLPAAVAVLGRRSRSTTIATVTVFTAMRAARSFQGGRRPIIQPPSLRRPPHGCASRDRSLPPTARSCLDGRSRPAEPRRDGSVRL